MPTRIIRLSGERRHPKANHAAHTEFLQPGHTITLLWRHNDPTLRLAFPQIYLPNLAIVRSRVAASINVLRPANNDARKCLQGRRQSILAERNELHRAIIAMHIARSRSYARRASRTRGVRAWQEERRMKPLLILCVHGLGATGQNTWGQFHRLIDEDDKASMEHKKREGYF